MATAKKTTRSPKAKQPAKATRKPRTKKASPVEKMSQMAAAERVLIESGEPMNCKAMVEAMTSQGYWSSPGRNPVRLAAASHPQGREGRPVQEDRPGDVRPQRQAITIPTSIAPRPVHRPAGCRSFIGET